MIWEELKKGIYIEEDNILIKWGIPARQLHKIGNPEVLNQNGKTTIIWCNKTILKELKGNWEFSFFPYEIFKSFNKIELIEIGDREAIQSYENYKKYFLKEIGKPAMSNELQNNNMELKWENDDYLIILYLFEMHCLRCNLTILKK